MKRTLKRGSKVLEIVERETIETGGHSAPGRTRRRPSPSAGDATAPPGRDPGRRRPPRHVVRRTAGEPPARREGASRHGPSCGGETLPGTTASGGPPSRRPERPQTAPFPEATRRGRRRPSPCDPRERAGTVWGNERPTARTQDALTGEDRREHGFRTPRKERAPRRRTRRRRKGPVRARVVLRDAARLRGRGPTDPPRTGSPDRRPRSPTTGERGMKGRARNARRRRFLSTRLETRTKESDVRASATARKTEGAMRKREGGAGDAPPVRVGNDADREGTAGGETTAAPKNEREGTRRARVALPPDRKEAAGSWHHRPARHGRAQHGRGPPRPRRAPPERGDARRQENGRPSGDGSEPEHVRQDPKDGDLRLRRSEAGGNSGGSSRLVLTCKSFFGRRA